MEQIKQTFIRLALHSNALQFGEFTLKSGRKSPYFFNAGLFYRGEALRQLGKLYAQSLVNHAIEFQHLFGPAYKGLPLATSTAIALAEMGIESTVTFNRKEAKDHGEGGQLIGSPLFGKTVIIDDVITAGTAFRESKGLIHAHGGQVNAVLIALDRCEKGQGSRSTLQEIQDEGIQVISLITLFDLIHYLNQNEQSGLAERLSAYQNSIGPFEP